MSAVLAEHSPPPWRIRVVGGLPMILLEVEEGTLIGIWNRGAGLNRTAEANLRLIAAAPRLYSAVTALIDTYQRPGWNEAVGDALAALREARGGGP